MVVNFCGHYSEFVANTNPNNGGIAGYAAVLFAVYLYFYVQAGKTYGTVP